MLMKTTSTIATATAGACSEEEEGRAQLLPGLQQPSPQQQWQQLPEEVPSYSVRCRRSAPPPWAAGLLLLGLSAALLLACHPPAAVAAGGPPPHRGSAPLRALAAAAGGGAIAGAWMAVGAFFGKIFGACAGGASSLCHACGGLSTEVCAAVGKCGSTCCGSLGGMLQNCPWCGGCLSNFWFALGNLFGGCFHAVVSFISKMYELAAGCLDGCCGAFGGLGSGCCSSVGACLDRICPV